LAALRDSRRLTARGGKPVKKVRVALLALVSVAVFAAPAAAAPPGQGLESLPADCDGTATTVTASSGASFWVGDQHYVLTSFTGTFTPEGGGTPETFTMTFGQRTGLGGSEITCSGSLVEPGEGTFAFTATGVAVPPGG
jgi:hypothetical protein